MFERPQLQKVCDNVRKKDICPFPLCHTSSPRLDESSCCVMAAEGSLVDNLAAGAGAGAGARGDAPALADHVYQLHDAKGDAGEDGKEDNDDDGDDVVSLHHGGRVVWLCGFGSCCLSVSTPVCVLLVPKTMVVVVSLCVSLSPG